MAETFYKSPDKGSALSCKHKGRAFLGRRFHAQADTMFGGFTLRDDWVHWIIEHYARESNPEPALRKRQSIQGKIDRAPSPVYRRRTRLAGVFENQRGRGSGHRQRLRARVRRCDGSRENPERLWNPVALRVGRQKEPPAAIDASSNLRRLGKTGNHRAVAEEVLLGPVASDCRKKRSGRSGWLERLF